MLRAQYIVRLDDASPYMAKPKWDRIISLLNAYSIKPIIAVIPDNRDKSLYFDNYDSSFFSKMRDVVKEGCSIALHGYQHTLSVIGRDIFGSTGKTEFAGLSLDEQKGKIRRGWALLKQEQLNPVAWIAPRHSFDFLTLRALREETNIQMVSDGFAFSPYYEHDFYWLPQQLWKFRLMPFGIWTICLHPNTMREVDFSSLEYALHKYKKHFISLNDVEFKKRKKSIIDVIGREIFLYLLKSKKKRTL